MLIGPRQIQFFYASIFLAAFFIIAAPARAILEYDLSMESGDIFFSQNPLVAGDKVRLYARVHNRGEKDVTGYVSFYQGTVLVGESQVISVRADSIPDEAFVDFVVPNLPFNIRAEIRGVAPEDQNPANDTAVSAMIAPLIDTDGDGLTDNKDNCPGVPNTDQSNTDGDALGDACDNDNNNNGIADDKEIAQSALPLSTESKAQNEDVHIDVIARTPTKVGGRSNLDGIATVPLDKLVASRNDKIAAGISADKIDDDLAEFFGEFVKENLFAEVGGYFSIEAKRLKWNRYQFRLAGMKKDGFRYVWRLNENIIGDGEEINYRFSAPGTYKVSIAVFKDDTEVGEASVVVTVSFFNFDNPWFVAMLAELGALSVVGLFFARSLKKA